MLRYRGHEIYDSGYETKKSMVCYGKKFLGTGYIYLIEGWAINATNPFQNKNHLNSIQACKDFIDEQIEMAGYSIYFNQNQDYIALHNDKIIAQARSLGKLYKQLNSCN